MAIDFTRNNGKQKRDYRPGDHVVGTVRANYFFGKPVDHADVTVKASSMDVTVFEVATVEGKTDSDGIYHFDFKLPNYFAGRPLSQGLARALVEATVKDSASHVETRGQPITISEAPLLIMAVPEGGTLIPNIENEIFVISSYPDGSPAQTTLTIDRPSPAPRNGHQPQSQRLSTDASGVAVFRLNPGAGVDALRIRADDHKGNRSASTVPLQMRGGTDQILLRCDQSIINAGDRIHISVFSTREHGTAYIDVVKDGQTILTKDLDLHNGQARLAIIATSEMAGTLDLDAYLFGRDAEPVADHRLVFVQPAEELKIDSTTDAAVYQPGSDARIRFHVTNARGQGVQAALGLEVVDEAVFALAEKQPGFAKVFFYLEQELMKSRYEIHSLSIGSVVEGDGKEPQDAAARALFAATELAMPAKLDIEFGRNLPQQKFAEYQERYRAAFEDQVRQIAAKLSQQLSDTTEDIDKAFARIDSGSTPRDAWNTPLRIEPAGWNRGKVRFYRICSAGADRRFGNEDDMAVFIEKHTGMLLHSPGQGGSLDLRIERDRGPMNGRAEITGTLTDASGAVIANGTITVHQLPAYLTRTAHTGADGHFDLAGLPAGQYRIQANSLGFAVLSSEMTLHARDRAVVSITLAVGAVTQAVMVEEAPRAPMPMAFAQGGPVAAGIGGRLFAAAKATNQFAVTDNMVLDRRSVNGPSQAATGANAANAPHVRSYFPEALYINPEILTDGNGDASISIPISDSITTWRMAFLASTQSGALGSGTASLKVFQDFFVDLDLPVTLTQGDRVSIPVAVYNYSGSGGEVALRLSPEDWFSLDNDQYDKSLQVPAGHVGSAQFTLNAKRIGKFKLTLSAHLAGAGNRDDIVVREIEVIPNGREQNLVFNGRLEKSAQQQLKFPADVVPDATSIVVHLYPGPLSQVIEGMDSILRMPGGCFEQTSSSTYPDVLALDYMKRTKKLAPEVHAKAEAYIANGYQRLLTFEVPGGGFSWFGQAPANKILTAYGLMEFNDMSKVSDVDSRLIQRTADWLDSQQQPDGSWKPDTYFINEGATDRYNSDALRITAYIAWSLANTGYKGGAVERAKRFIEEHAGASHDPYTLAVIANFAIDYAGDRDFTRAAMQALIDARTEKGDQVSWASEETGVYSTGESAANETTGLATQALLKWGQAPEIARKALSFISGHKQASGNWGTTQATIMALRALLLSTQLNASNVRGSLTALLDGKTVETLQLTTENNDLLHQFVLKGINPASTNNLQFKFEGSGSLAYQVVGRYFIPWDKQPAGEALSIDVAYDRTEIAQNDIVTATATIRNNLPKNANMVMVDLGIPPGFDLLSEDLQSFQEKALAGQSGRLEKFSLTATQAILYFNTLSPHQALSIKFRLRAKYPIRARTFSSRVYEYYDPAVSSIAKPVELSVVECKNCRR
ncbi:MAG: carboxypeptidase regulatory-like domain-containing protein [Terracidiphilus sp.]